MKGTGDVRQTLMILGGLVVVASLCALGARFSSNATVAAAARA
jgi:NNP family nitrate/nitrite transporter-like MFS transporter